MKTYFVANNNGDILGHDLDLAAAEQCLSAALKDDPNNEQEWEILSDDDEDDLTFSLLLNLHRVSMAELNRRYRIPKRTMEDWKSGRRTPPEWVLTLLQIAIENQK